METLIQLERPSKSEQKAAMESYSALASVIAQSDTEGTEIEIEKIKGKIKIPLSVLKILGGVLKAMSQGKFVSIVPIATEVTTQRAAEVLGCSRPHLVKLLEDGQIAYTKVGKHRRLKFDDVLQYKKRTKESQKQHIIDIMNFDEEKGLYDS